MISLQKFKEIAGKEFGQDTFSETEILALRDLMDVFAEAAFRDWKSVKKPIVR